MHYINTHVCVDQSTRTPMSMKNQNSFLHSEANLTSKLSLTNTAEVERTDSNIPISKKMKTTGMECADQVVFNAPHPVLIIPSDNQEEKFDDIMIEEFLQPIVPSSPSTSNIGVTNGPSSVIQFDDSIIQEFSKPLNPQSVISQVFKDSTFHNCTIHITIPNK